MEELQEQLAVAQRRLERLSIACEELTALSDLLVVAHAPPA
ncbi:hypothetical protein ACIBP6_03485 [Nonomuraea terrae]